MILITGASGNVGREVLKQMVQAGAKIRAAYQDASKANLPSEIEVATVDFNRPETLKTALRGVDRVFLVGPPTAELVALENKAVDVIKQSNIQQLVKLSAMAVARLYSRASTPSRRITFGRPAFPPRSCVPTDSCRISSITVRAPSMRRTLFTVAKETARSATSISATSQPWLPRF